ncbi:MAG: hypothetical protein HXX08_08595 [Chloroflexi bacterium]|uniref:DUF3887 domain-containing protein n=1 Tax=Candidatus Chlorohelix allophototropha TaxID=3003348 RepID=A0A8T7LY46_9CHLR|nr:hypothetical protein [Chloroflexota bacterium]WJW67784.1 hypothetical protein OZ401_001063 [Chloroflexota bacterium L227-S17]
MLLFRVFGRLLTRFFGGLGRFTIGIFKFFGRHETILGGVVLTAVVVGGIWLLITILNINIVVGNPQPVVSKSVSAQASATSSKISTTNAPQITEAFMRGQIYLNADDVWNSLDAQLQNQLAQMGRGKDYFAQQFAQFKERGMQYQEYRYIGGFDGGDGQTIHFYVARYLNINKQIIDEPFTLVVAGQGKIIAFN